ncbi:MAG TPA: glutamine--tRNA ligase/YqeY domain fusion protein [Acidobacteriota bacterium]|nr:glutamine--tRNA ligase/YqeY domain fusion protein [Acidobacteriota bacterium]HNT17137.1 glutamine--tRNA ligase/YqeY domain fusion protein [Acidobacteriota bacterium]
MAAEEIKEKGSNFIREIVKQDISSGKIKQVVTRFPPEPNGYLHIGHAKAITIDFGLAKEFGGKCHLRFDDTNPSREEQEYVDSIQEDIRWLGWDWGDNLFYASNYFDKLCEWAVHLIQKGKAYVCDLTPDEVREHRGTLTEPGRNCCFRNRSAEENLDLFTRMKNGEFPDGSRTLRAKIDMAHPNINMRDPVLYRILRATHHRTGDKWCIYPTYDYAHGQSDAIEGITHSICTLEFEAHRPLYDWFVENLPVEHKPHQYEFARLNINYTVLSKRKLLTLVTKGFVSGWDDPRMPTLAGFRRRGFTPSAIRNFCESVGVAKANSTVDLAFLEECLRDDLNKKASRRMAVLKPLKLVIENYPDGKSEELEVSNNPEDPSYGTRMVRFSKVLYIDREDFSPDPPPKFFRLAPGREVRLRNAYYVTCTGFKTGDNGEVVEVTGRIDEATRGGSSPDGRSPKVTIHWVSAADSVEAEVRLYDRLFVKENPDQNEEGKDFLDHLNPDSLVVLKNCKLERSLEGAKPVDIFQFERVGYFAVDRDSSENALVFNRAVTLKDTWAKLKNKK